MKRYNIICWR